MNIKHAKNGINWLKDEDFTKHRMQHIKIAQHGFKKSHITNQTSTTHENNTIKN